MAIHIGKIIKEEVLKQGVSVSAFAKKINRSRNVVYDIFERSSIDTGLLNKISMVLRKDFFSIYSIQKEFKKEGVVPFDSIETKQAQVFEIENIRSSTQIHTMQNEIAYLKKIISLLESKKKSKK